MPSGESGSGELLAIHFRHEVIDQDNIKGFAEPRRLLVVV